MRVVALVAALAFIALLTALTVNVAVRSGVDILVVLSGVVLVLFAVGIVGALLEPPEK